MSRAVLYTASLIVIVAGAAGLRVARLDNRPMHCDEAVHAIKFGQLLEHGDYVYSPQEYHGPTLNYLTLPIAYCVSARTLTEITEVHLRLVPAIFGTVLVLLVWLLRDQIGRTAVLSAALFTAVSPAMVFYSRYYIQEMLLVCFSCGALVVLLRSIPAVGPVPDSALPARHSWIRQLVWASVLGLYIGMMHATKETCVIPLFAMALGVVLVSHPFRRMGAKRIVLSGLVVVTVAAGVSALFCSSFLTNARGVVDSYTTYLCYLDRALGEGGGDRHVYPWHYYLRVLYWWNVGDGPIWTEGVIAVLALVGVAAGIVSRDVSANTLPAVRLLSIYTVAMAVGYSAVPYKTPWCALGFHHGMILLAGVGASVMLRMRPVRRGRP